MSSSVRRRKANRRVLRLRPVEDTDGPGSRSAYLTLGTQLVDAIRQATSPRKVEVRPEQEQIWGCYCIERRINTGIHHVRRGNCTGETSQDYRGRNGR